MVMRPTGKSEGVVRPAETEAWQPLLAESWASRPKQVTYALLEGLGQSGTFSAVWVCRRQFG